MNTNDRGRKQKRIAELNNLSRALSHALRHEPWLYELELDNEGWASVESILVALRKEQPQWADFCEADLARMREVSSKRRHEVKDGRIRALYGHSIPGKLKKMLGVPPDTLFHGTSPSCLSAIRSSGLLPMARQYVHLSTDVGTALAVGRRKSKCPTILRIQARQASEANVQFYIGNEKVWLADHIPPEFIVVEHL